MNDIMENDQKPDISLVFRPNISQDLHRLVMYTEGKDGKYHAMFQTKGLEQAKAEWFRFIDAIGPSADYKTLRASADAYWINFKEANYESKIEKDYARLVGQSFEARITSLARQAAWEQVHSSASPWKEIGTSLGTLNAVEAIMDTKDQLAKEVDLLNLPENEKDIIRNLSEFEIVQAIKEFQTNTKSLILSKDVIAHAITEYLECESIMDVIARYASNKYEEKTTAEIEVHDLETYEPWLVGANVKLPKTTQQEEWFTGLSNYLVPLSTPGASKEQVLKHLKALQEERDIEYPTPQKQSRIKGVLEGAQNTVTNLLATINEGSSLSSTVEAAREQ